MRRRSERFLAGGPRSARTNSRARNRRGKAVRLLAGVMAAAVLVAGGALSVWWFTFERTQYHIGEAGLSVTVEVPEGASTARIAGALAEAGVVPNANRFRLEVRLAGADGMLRAGTYELATGMSYDEVIAVLINGSYLAYVDVTIPEGFTVEQIAVRFEEQAGIPAEEFIALAASGYAEFPRAYLRDAFGGKLEGFLFPKTYRIPERATAHDVIGMMLDQFEREIAVVDLAAAEARGFSLNEIVTMASIIEREASVPGERPLVSSVIHNRLERGMRLQMCATVEYVLPGNRLRLTYEDLKVDSPYNTYLVEGLPPGPISNPGLDSLKAAAAPADTDYLYYVLTGEDGSHTFTETWQEFERARELSREVFGE